MATEQILKTIFQVKRGNASAWKSVNPILRVGEPGFEIDTNRLKIGNGSTAYNDLPYLNQEEIDNLELALNDLKEIIGSEEAKTGLFAILDEKADISNVYTKKEIEGLISGVYHYKGSKHSFQELPTEGNMIGDVWNIETSDEEHNISAGDNVAWNGESWDRLSGFIDLSNYVTIDDLNDLEESIPLYYITKKEALKTLSHIKYEVLKPRADVLVNYRDKEIRVMFPKDMPWTTQSVGPTGNSSNYYFEFRAYAPEEAVSFKEDDAEIINDDTMYYFENNSFAGIDEFGRKFSRLWLPAANVDAEGNWTYYGENSNFSKYIGWYYTVNWYNAEGKVIDSDRIRINLSNEKCHDVIEPFYMGNVIKGIIVNGQKLDVVENQVTIPFSVPVSSSEDNHITIKDDGTMEINSISVNKLVQEEDAEPIVYDGGVI